MAGLLRGLNSMDGIGVSAAAFADDLVIDAQDMGGLEAAVKYLDEWC